MRLSTISSLALVTASSSLAAPAPPGHGHGFKAPGLNDLAKAAGLLYFGTAIDNVVLNNTHYTSIAHNSSEFGQATPSNGQKWMYIEPSRNVFNYSMGDAIIVPAKQNHQMRRCHTFLWHNQLPTWLTGRNWTKAELTSVLENHIKNEATHYKNDCYAWDVVNEAFNDDGTYRKDLWLDTLGPEYIPLAFKLARKYVGRDTKLYYNDYGVERVNNKSIAISKKVGEWLAADVPIDGLGFQAHFTIGRAPNYTEIRSSMQQFTSQGLEVALTELDVRVDLPSTAEKQTRQASVYSESVRACRDEEECVGVTVWDFWDPVSWVPDTFPGYGDACLWDKDFVRKPAYYAIADMLKE